MKKLYLIDGMSLVFRAYHAMFRSNLTSPEGMPSGAVFGFINILTNMLEKENPDRIAVVFDRHEPTFRHEMYEAYKANRDEFPEDLGPQLALIKEMLDHLNIPRLEKPGYEADDLIGTLSNRASQKGWEVYCLTSDKDFYQLVNDHVKIYKPRTKGEFEIIGYEGVKEKFGVKPPQVIDVLALIGDASDNVPGVKGIGEKTAIPLIQEYGSLEALYDNLDKVTKKAVKTKLENNRDSAFLSKKLVTIITDIELDIDYEDCVWQEPSYEKLDELFAKLGFKQMREKWRGKAGEQIKFQLDIDDDLIARSASAAKINTIDDIEKSYRLIKSEQELELMIDKLSGYDFFALDIETSSLDRDRCALTGISFSAEEGYAYYVPVYNDEVLSKLDGDGLFDVQLNPKKWELSLPAGMVLDKLKPILENKNIGKCGQNIKYDVYILRRFGVKVSPVIFDSMIASYVINPDEKHSMDALAQKWMNYKPIPISSLIGEKKSMQKSMEDIDPAVISDYACEDADVALKLRNVLDKALREEKLDKLAYEVEFPMIEVLNEMESRGVEIDTSALADISQRLALKAQEMTELIYKEAACEFNIDSPKQLGHILFEKMMIPSVKKTKTGFSTDVQVLTSLAETFPIANYILEYRQLVKLKSTYVDALPKLINPVTGRIHTTYNQTVASTGRLSSTDPNLQNIPIRSDAGKEIRRAFIPSEGRVMFSADYSQIELRIMAYICGDSHLINSFIEGHDIHSATASVLYDKPLEDVTQDMRRIAKTVNFGIMYGLGSFGLSQRLGLGRKESQEIIDNYFAKYPGIRKYIDLTIEECRKKGYAETIMGRRRYFPDINHKNRNLRNAAERGAINMPIQGTASDMMKIAMINIHREMKNRKFRSDMILQVHDELVFDVLPEELDDLKKLVISNMESALPLGKVPVIADTGTGKNWFEAH
ncbi:MAG: DNA polymerase I [Candidatus Kapaibacterium sp.]